MLQGFNMCLTILWTLDIIVLKVQSCKLKRHRYIMAYVFQKHPD